MKRERAPQRKSIEVRAQILAAIRNGTHTRTDIAQTIGMNPGSLSRHLTAMKKSGQIDFNGILTRYAKYKLPEQASYDEAAPAPERDNGAPPGADPVALRIEYFLVKGKLRIPISADEHDALRALLSKRSR